MHRVGTLGLVLFILFAVGVLVFLVRQIVDGKRTHYLLSGRR